MPSLRSLVLVAAVLSAGGNWSSPTAGESASGQPEVIFTFDDGPHHKTTPKVLDMLAARGIQAIFFLTGDHFTREDSAKSQALVARMLREGHVVANHTMTHQQLCAVKPERAAWEIDHARTVLEREAKMKVPWFRAPYGAWCPRLVTMLEERGLTHFYWEIDPQEWRSNNAKTTVWKVTWHLKRLQGRAVLLLHDTKAVTVKALPKILEWLDAENARRAAAGQKQIKIVSGADYAAELLGKEMLDEARAVVDDALNALTGGLASALP